MSVANSDVNSAHIKASKGPPGFIPYLSSLHHVYISILSGVLADIPALRPESKFAQWNHSGASAKAAHTDIREQYSDLNLLLIWKSNRCKPSEH